MRSQTPKLIGITLVLLTIALLLSFQFKVEAAQLRDQVRGVMSHLMKPERPVPFSPPAEPKAPDIPEKPGIAANPETQPEPEEPAIPEVTPEQPSDENLARELFGQGLWYEETGNIRTAKLKYKDCVQKYPGTKTARNAQKFLDYWAGQGKPAAPLLPEIMPEPEAIPAPLSEGDALYQKGLEHMRKAFEYKPGYKRNQEFIKAEDFFRKALEQFLPLYRKNDNSELELKIIRVQEQLYSSQKLRTL